MTSEEALVLNPEELTAEDRVPLGFFMSRPAGPGEGVEPPPAAGRPGRATGAREAEERAAWRELALGLRESLADDPKPPDPPRRSRKAG
jgi:hypothetical protein